MECALKILKHVSYRIILGISGILPCQGKTNDKYNQEKPLAPTFRARTFMPLNKGAEDRELNNDIAEKKSDRLVSFQRLKHSLTSLMLANNQTTFLKTN